MDKLRFAFKAVQLGGKGPSAWKVRCSPHVVFFFFLCVSGDNESGGIWQITANIQRLKISLFVREGMCFMYLFKYFVEFFKYRYACLLTFQHVLLVHMEHRVAR